MLLLLLAACFESAECRSARDAATAAWTTAADVLEAQARGAQAQAQAGVERARAVDQKAEEVQDAVKPRTPASKQAQDAYVRAMALGGRAGEAVAAANRAEMATKLRDETAELETAARRTDALATRLGAWAFIEVGWREAGGLARAGGYARKIATGELPIDTELPYERLPVQVGNTRDLPESPVSLDEIAAGAAGAHAAFLKAGQGAAPAKAAVQDGDYRVKGVLSYIEREGIPAEGEVLSASNEARMAIRHGDAALKALDAAQAPPANDALTQVPEVAAARAASTQIQAVCK